MARFWAWIRKRRFQRHTDRLLARAGLEPADRFYSDEWTDAAAPAPVNRRGTEGPR